MKYKEELNRTMKWLGEQNDTVFIGQSCREKGTSMFESLSLVPLEKRIEYFVSENNQMGVSIGMALGGSKVISIFPRVNFLMCAMDQLFNHLDKINEYSHGEFSPSLIIRTGIGSVRPLHPQAQHCGDPCEALKCLFKNIEVIRLEEPEQIFEAYQKAYEREDGKSTLIVEISDYLNEK